MTIIAHTTQHGKVIQTLALDDLGRDVVMSGTRFRVRCPIHGGDHQRSLSIDVVSGWGFCHCCHATVFVQDIAQGCMPIMSVGHGGRDDQPRGHHHGVSAGKAVSHDHTMVARSPSSRQERTPRVASPPRWQQEERRALVMLAPQLQVALASSWRAQAYLHERGIPTAIAQASGVGYLSHAVWQGAALSEEHRLVLQRWVGRLLFPLHSPGGCGFIGRTLRLWQAGMDENAHKAVLDRPRGPRRWMKTNPAGWSGFADPASLCNPLILVEGGFDRLALLAAGFPAASVLALAGTAARPAWLRRFAPQVKQVVLALDADASGRAAMERLAVAFRAVGIVVTPCPPAPTSASARDSEGKDWSERWRKRELHSIRSLYALLA